MILADMDFRLQRVVRLTTFDDERREQSALAFWRSRPAEERLAAVEFLREQFYESGVRLRRVHRLVDRT
jgi:hypothetical protein